MFVSSGGEQNSVRTKQPAKSGSSISYNCSVYVSNMWCCNMIKTSLILEFERMLYNISFTCIDVEDWCSYKIRFSVGNGRIQTCCLFAARTKEISLNRNPKQYVPVDQHFANKSSSMCFDRLTTSMGSNWYIYPYKSQKSNWTLD